MTLKSTYNDIFSHLCKQVIPADLCIVLATLLPIRLLQINLNNFIRAIIETSKKSEVGGFQQQFAVSLRC